MAVTGGPDADDRGGGGVNEPQTRVRGNDVHGNSEGLRVLRGDESDAAVDCQTEGGGRSRGHCVPGRPDPMAARYVWTVILSLSNFPFLVHACCLRFAWSHYLSPSSASTASN